MDEITENAISLEELQDALGPTATVTDEKHNAHTFINAVATSDDTTKVGNLREEEVGIPTLSTRTLKELALFANDIADEKTWGEYLNARSEILTSTSLSKDAKLLDTAVVTRREFGNIGTTKKVKKNWRGKEIPVKDV